MLNLEEEQRILENAPPYLRAAIGLLAQTGGRTYTEGFSLRWDQIDLDHNVIFFRGKTKTEGSSEPLPTPDRACPRCSPPVEEGAGRQEPIPFSESGQTRPTDHHG